MQCCAPEMGHAAPAADFRRIRGYACPRTSRNRGTSFAQPGPSMTDWVAPPRVLIVDDSDEQVRQLKRSIDGLDDAAGSILMLASALEARDPSTKGHCDRLADYGVRLGQRLSLGLQDLRALHLGGYLHDLGKVAVPDAVLFKPGRLT